MANSNEDTPPDAPVVITLTNLPDDIIRYILSFLPFDQSVPTAILSKRWYVLWKSLSSILIDDSAYLESKKKYTHFSNMVTSFLESRDGLIPIRDIRIQCGSLKFCTSQLVANWILALLQHARTMEISMPCKKVKLQNEILISQNLVVLKLSGLTVSWGVTSPNLPKLEHLSLSMVKFKSRSFFEEILQGCPILQQLDIKSLRFDDKFSGERFRGLANLATVRTTDVSLLLVQSRNFGLPTFSNLTTLEITRGTRFGWKWLLNRLQHFPQLKSLILLYGNTFSVGAIYVMEEAAPQTGAGHIPTTLEQCTIDYYKPSENGLGFMIYVLENSKALHKMTVRFCGWVSTETKYQDLQKLASVKRSHTCELHFQ